MFTFFENLYNNFLSRIYGIWDDFVEFFEELPIKILDQILGAIATVIESIPVPDFITDNSLQDVFNTFPSDLNYFLIQSGFASAMAIVSAGLGFRMLRKVLTLFQW